MNPTFGPLIPLGPAVPAFPVSPGSPTSPGGPLIPLRPRFPSGPMGPLGPFRPRGPSDPGSPYAITDKNTNEINKILYITSIIKLQIYERACSNCHFHRVSLFSWGSFMPR